jgi:hypothetical protein
MMAVIEKSIHEALPLFAADTHVDLLIRQLAQTRLEVVFERAYGAIFGTQFALLRALMGTGGTMSLATVLQFFGEAKSKGLAAAELIFENWLRYPRVFELVEVDAEEVKITNLGRDFLIFLSAKGLREDRPN